MLHSMTNEGAKRDTGRTVQLDGVGRSEASFDLQSAVLSNQAYLKMPVDRGIVSPARTPVLQRQCACGASTGIFGECAECKEKKEETALHRKAAGDGAAPDVAPPIVHEVLRSSGAPLDAETRAAMEPRFGADFGAVRVHTGSQAATSARAVNARAYTVGRDIVFAGGQHSPHSEQGRRLIAHELTHVVQQSASAARSARLAIGPDDDVFEREADAMAQGAPAGPLASGTAPASLQRQTPSPAPAPAPAALVAAGTFASEAPDLKTRRLEAIAAARTAITRIAKGMQSGYLWPDEVASAQGEITHPTTFPNVKETKGQRDTRLQALRADLVAMIQTLESAPIPQAWLAPQATFPATATSGGGTMASSSTKQPWVDVTTFYAIRASALGRNFDDVFLNWAYIDVDPIPKKVVAPKLVGTALELGTQIVVEDPENNPLNARLANNNDGKTKETEIYSLWKDDLGYFYIYNNERHYLKDRPGKVPP